VEQDALGLVGVEKSALVLDHAVEHSGICHLLQRGRECRHASVDGIEAIQEKCPDLRGITVE
jgi:hypothetical protein